MWFSRPERVLAEFARVLVPKGRVALSWWDGFGKNRINGIFFEAINELGISAPGALPAGPAVDRFSDPNEFAEVLRAAGFEVAGIDSAMSAIASTRRRATSSSAFLRRFLEACAQGRHRLCRQRPIHNCTAARMQWRIGLED